MSKGAQAREWGLRAARLEIGRRTLVMGVLNVTPDSFSDGGRFLATDTAVARAKEMAALGADIVDIGGESTRPGARPVAWKEEWERVEPVLEALRAKSSKFSTPISIDTRNWRTAELALERGVQVVNDVTGMRNAQMRGVCADAGAGVVVMHMLGDPQTMQIAPEYGDVVREVFSFLKRRVDACAAHGIPRERICVDPGIGFGKTIGHNLALLSSLEKLRSLGLPVLVGVSRKSFIGKLTGREADRRLSGSLGAAVAAVARGADIVRTHDVEETADALRVADAIVHGPGAVDAWAEADEARKRGGRLAAGGR